MADFFRSFEEEICKQFKMWPIAQKEEVLEMLKKETEEKQQKMEARAMAEYEARKAEEERIREEQAKNAAPAGKAPPKKPDPKKGGKDDKPNLNLPQLKVPETSNYTSVMGNEYICERQLTDIAKWVLTPLNPEEEGEA